MEEVEHEHELKLIDLHLKYADRHVEDDDEVLFLIAWGEIGVVCHRCRQEINMLHRYYYKCMGELCTFSVHEFCYDLSKTLQHPLHPHPLILTRSRFGQSFENRCRVCHTHHENSEVHYQCLFCDFYIYVNCALKIEKNTIHHPSHPHLLMSAIAKHILCECSACGKRHEGVFYQCTTCVGFTIHKDCAKLPRYLLIQERTDGAFYHIHPLTISYSFPEEDQKAKHHPRCRVCTNGFYDMENLWIYKCDVCMYYAHVDCATSRGEPFMSIFSPAGSGKTIKNFEDVGHPHLLHLPFPDESYSLPKHLFFKVSGTFIIDKVNLQHISHQHPLILVHHTQTSSSKINSSWLLKCHNPMKKTQLLCNGCLGPITSTMPFYKCPQQSCNDFALHEWCTRLPQKIENHPGHPEHTLHLMYPHVLPHFFGVFLCDVCDLPCNGFSYCCVECEYYVDVGCGLIPREITHKAHPDHLLSIVRKSFFRKSCHICLLPFRWTSFAFPIRGFRLKDQVFFGCNVCDVYIHPECALLLSEKIMHKCDKHLMHLSYLPIENHKSEYFCEICEEDLNPHESFYHCQDCVQSIHTACAPLILQCETNTYTWEQRSIYYYVNIKFGGTYNTDAHPHPLSFSQGIMSDGECRICRKKLHCQMIFKCLECEFALDYKCCRSL